MIFYAPLHCRIEEGAEEVEVEDWDTGETVLLRLDGGLSAAANAAQLYKKARKQRRAADKIVPLLAAADAQVRSAIDVTRITVSPLC